MARFGSAPLAGAPLPLQPAKAANVTPIAKAQVAALPAIALLERKTVRSIVTSGFLITG